MKHINLTLISVGLFSSIGAQAASIDFEDFGSVGIIGPIVSNQYKDVVFSSPSENPTRVTTQPGIGFDKNFLCSGTSTLNCLGDTTITFATPVSDLKFYAIGSESMGATAKVDIFSNGSLIATKNIITNGIFKSPNIVDLSSYAGISAIRLHSITDGGGLGWDNFQYTATAVPEASTFALMLLGLAGLGFVARDHFPRKSQ